MRLAMALGTLLALWGLAWALLPGIIKTELEKTAGAQLGRQVSVAAVDFRPWSLEIGLHGLRIADAAGGAAQLEIGYVHVNAELQSLLRLAPVIDELRIEGLRLRLTHQGQGRYDVDDIVQRLTAPGQPSASPPRFALYNVALRDGAVDFVDAPAGKTHELRDLTLTIPFLSNLPAARDVLTEPRLAFRLNGAAFDSAAQSTPFAPTHKSAVTLRLQQLDVRPYLPYLPRDLPLRPLTGVLDADLQLAFEQEAERPRLKLTGTLALHQARLADAQRREVLAWQSLRVQLDDVRPLERVLRLTALDLRAPSATLWPVAADTADMVRATPRPAGRAVAPHGPEAAWRIELARLAVHDVRVRAGDAAGASAPVRRGRRAAQGAAEPDGVLTVAGIEAHDLRLDSGARRLSLGRLAIAQPALALERSTDGHWMFERWLPPRAPAAAAAPAGGDWGVALGALALEGGSVRYADRAAARPVLLDVGALSVQAEHVTSDGGQPAALRLALQVRAGSGEPGRVTLNGTLNPQPLALRARLEASRVPLHALAPYLGDRLNVALPRADAGFRGDLAYTAAPAGPTLRASGDALLENVSVQTLAAADGGGAPVPDAQELLSWKALSARGVDVAMAPAQPVRVAVAETALTDFYARVIIDDKGRINLQDIFKPAAAASADTPADTAGPAPQVRMGPVSLVNGHVQFSDHFIRPNYSADLTELTGRLSAFASASASATTAAAPAELELRGRAEGTATIELRGQINPLAQPLTLDIRGQLRDLELAPLSPYSVKYAGHGIERGKLSLDVSYQVQPDGHLQASNRLILHQLSFGDAVEGAPASLPVRLAVALLADRNGVIDVDLPISGSLNDPEFHLGAIVFKLVTELVVKAITAPFHLLAAAFGGGEELSAVAFAAGTALLDAPARAGLDKVAAALQQRPGLDLTVVGSAGLAQEREAFKRARLDALVLAEKQRAAAAATTGTPPPVPLSAGERSVLLREVYRRANIPKPRNLIGLLKELPPADMENLLLASLPVGEEDMRALALARAEAVRDYLLGRGVPVERLYLGAVKPLPPEAREPPRAELHLTRN